MSSLIIFEMAQAQIKEVDGSLPFPVCPVEIYWNNLTVEIIPAARTNGKYKKVTLESKQALIGLVKNGSSIINVISSSPRLPALSRSIIPLPSPSFKTSRPRPPANSNANDSWTQTPNPQADPSKRNTTNPPDSFAFCCLQNMDVISNL